MSSIMTDRVISNVTTKWKRVATIGSLVAVGILAVLAYDFIQERQPTLVELKKTAVSVPYDDLTRKPEDHIGQIVRFIGKVIQVVPGEHNNKDIILIIWVGKGLTSLNDVVYVEYQPGVREPTILKNDVVEFWGKFKGIKTPEANHGNTDVPQVVAYEMQRVE
jgi:starvation-inducible outer membrane lipoprotein